MFFVMLAITSRQMCFGSFHKTVCRKTLSQEARLQRHRTAASLLTQLSGRRRRVRLLLRWLREKQ